MVDDVEKWLATFIVALILLYILFMVLIKRRRERQRPARSALNGGIVAGEGDFCL